MKPIVSVTIDLDLQFYDFDPMAVCWHGNYVRFFEQVRCALFKKIDYDYLQMNESGYYPSEIKNQEACTGCLNCMISCPDFAIIVEKDAKPSTDANEDHHAIKR